jgi:DNA-binding NarL/FixJ family response regulator
MIRVLLAEDQLMFRTAVRRLLNLEDDIEVVAEVGRGDELVEAAHAAEPDIAVVDIELPTLDGISAAAQLRKSVPGCRTLILTMYGRPGFVQRAMEAGVAGFVLKDAPVEVLATAIRRCAAGENVVDPTLQRECSGPERARCPAGSAKYSVRAPRASRASSCRSGCAYPRARSAIAYRRSLANWTPGVASRPCRSPETTVGCEAANYPPHPQ